MRIAQIAPLFEAVPPKLYGGTERVVSWLTEELVAMGHDVTLFASGNSVTSAKLEPTWPNALRLDPTILDWFATYYVMLDHVFRRAHKFDILHFHIDYFPNSAVPAPADAVPDHVAWPARPARTRRGLPHLSRRAAGFHFQQPAQAACPTRTGSAPSITA